MMDSTLHFGLEPKTHPYAEDRRAPLEAWGHLRVEVLVDPQWIPLLDWQWDLSELVEWFAENRAALSLDTLSIRGEGPLPFESLAQAVARLQDRDFADDEREAETLWFDALFAYRERHALRSALRGAGIPDVFVGCNRSAGEISLGGEEGAWSYRFDMEAFLADLRQESQRFLLAWLSGVRDPAARARADQLLALLERPNAAVVAPRPFRPLRQREGGRGR